VTLSALTRAYRSASIANYEPYTTFPNWNLTVLEKNNTIIIFVVFIGNTYLGPSACKFDHLKKNKIDVKTVLTCQPTYELHTNT
jgi:hypothetical protein